MKELARRPKDAKKRKKKMVEEIKDEIVESSTTEDEEISESSTEETQDEEATSEKATEEVPFNEHPRFKQLIEEKNELKDEVKQLRNQVFDAVKPKEVEHDPMAGKTAEEKDFWREVDKRAELAAVKQRKNAEAEMQAVRNEYGKLAANQFLKDHSDVKKGSDELKDIVKKAQEIGGNLEDAYKVVMFDANAQREVEKVKKVKQEKTREKMAANVETKNLSPTGIKAKEDLSFGEAFEDAWKKNDVVTEDFS